MSPADPPSRPVLGALAVVLRDGHALLARRGKEPDAGLWGFPGGHVELGETALDAAVRELREETGIAAEALEYLTNIDVLRHDADGRPSVHYLLAAVLCDYVDGTPVADDDIVDARWVALDVIAKGGLPMSDRVHDIADMARRRLRDRTR